MKDLKQQFDEAVNYVQNGEGSLEPSNDSKLQLYALYKQATEGDVRGKKPGLLDVVGRAKFNAWNELKGKPSDQAMREYVDLLRQLLG